MLKISALLPPLNNKLSSPDKVKIITVYKLDYRSL